ncbi:hypothetical protein L207DRAFT_583539 [Hyaloscypha variabilis F]|uniref:BTB domain-containing protein n=1 Tax=Hyaloscypha variabilis (strain UAMH 11265 / GT02V1 / F) TaxID=1149755 RepID=A0A2J6RMF3_HYAVF|nr:hypothetical protein L207DRAFT_583539 [Hyaloscypha variabilis F]
MADASSVTAPGDQSPLSYQSTIASSVNGDDLREPDFSNMDEVVTLIVDSYGGLDAKTKFIVHKSFVCHYSPVVKAVFENGPRYPRNHRLYNTSSNTAQLLVQWIYTQKVDSSKLKEEAAGELKTQSLVFVWALAERLQIPRLQNAVIRELQALRNRGEPVATLSLAYVYENFPPANPLRR